uniref:Alpha-1,2-fucosyltransferase n=1 Tax=viral metagenome TaxID=1070528 RepID=A0A6C0I9Q4_9ZZZZ
MAQLYTSIEVSGGLGSQLFQLAYIISFLRLSKKNRIKRKLVFKEGNASKDVYRKTHWNTLFQGLFRVVNASDFEKIPFNSLYIEVIPHKYIEPKADIKDNVFFDGKYQTFKYIDDSLREKMTNIIYSNEDIMYPAYYKYRDILDYFGSDTKDNDMVSLHIRRGDYLSLSNYNYNLEMNYYKEALQIANKKNVVVFSDDIEWCINNFNDYVNRDGAYNVYFVSNKIYKETEVLIKDDIELILMSMFQNNIIANSCFSLWASFISFYKNKIVVAPKRWYSCDGCKEYDEVYHKYITHYI